MALLVESESDFSKTEEAILHVHFQPNDFSWLEDVRTVLLAKLRHKYGRSDESVFKEKFLQRQKLLFEPDHAVSFFLLKYQELLKQEYQRSAASKLS